MDKLDIIWRIAELIIAIVSASVITRILTIRERIKQEKANAAKMEEEVKTNSIDNIRKTMEEVYKPIIDDLQKTIADARHDAQKACDRVNELEDKVDALEQENRELRRENAALRDALREIRPDIVPSKRSENAQNQPRGRNGQFTKRAEKEDGV